MSQPKHENETSKVVEFMVKLQEDSKFLAEFNKDPDGVMTEAGLYSEEVRNELKSGDILKIRQLLGRIFPSW